MTATSDALERARPARSARTRDLALAAWQVGYEQRAFWRNRTRAFFSFVFPLMFLRALRRAQQGQQTPASWAASRTTSSSCPGILAYGVIMTTFANMAVSIAIHARQRRAQAHARHAAAAVGLRRRPDRLDGPGLGAR